MRARIESGVAALLLFAGACSDPPAQSAAKPGIDPAAWPPFTVLGTWGERARLTFAVEGEGGPLPPGTLAEAVREAAARWNAVSPLRLEEAPPGTAADVHYRWAAAATDAAPDAPFGRDTSVARARPPGPGCEVLFDASRAWRVAPGDEPGDEPGPAPAGLSGAPLLLRAAVHETGHALGLGHTPDPRALMHPRREGGRLAPAPQDVAGVVSLYRSRYKAPEDAGPDDLVVAGEGGARTVLRGLAPAGVGFDAFDADGDGDDELALWDADGSRLGALLLCDFAAGPRLAGTVGPDLGVVPPGGSLALEASADARVLWSRSPVGEVARPLDAGGRPGRPAPRPRPAAWLELGAGGPVRADLDGDGILETIYRGGS